MLQALFEARLRYLKVFEDGSERLITEPFLIDAVNYTDAEAKMTEEAEKMVKGGDFTVKGIKTSNIGDIFGFETGEWWWKCKVSLDSIDERSGREYKTIVYCLVLADDAREAIDRLDESLCCALVTYDVITVSRSPICDVFLYDVNDISSQMPKGLSAN